MTLRINEISVSTTGVDREFIEIAGDIGADLTGLSILEIASGGEVMDAISLSGHTGVNGSFLVASPAAEAQFGLTADIRIADNTFNNASRTYLLVQDYTGGIGADIDLDDDGTLDQQPWRETIDSVAVIDDDGPLIYSANVVGPDGTFLAAGGYRDPAVTGGFVMLPFADFSVYTPTPSSDVLINEIVVSTTGTDWEYAEFVALPGSDLSGYTLLEIASGGEIMDTIALTGSAGEGNGRHLVASPAAEARFGVTGDRSIADNTFNNASRTYLLVEGFTGASGADIDADDDGVIDAAAWARVADSVAIVANDSPVVYSGNVVGPDGSFLAPGAIRSPAASGGFDMLPFADDSAYSPEAASDFVINEIVVSNTGTDWEFVEIFGSADTDISNLSLVSIRSGGEIDDIIDFAGSTGGGGFFLAASPGAIDQFGIVPDQEFANNTLTNASRTYVLVSDFTGTAGEDLDTDDDGTIDVSRWSALFDSVAVIDDDGPIVYSRNVVGPDGTFLAPGASRLIDGIGDFFMHDFSDPSLYSPTPGSTAEPLVLNEIVVSTTGTDPEFVELRGGAGTSLAGWSLIALDALGEVTRQVDFTGSVGDNGYYLVTSIEAVTRLGVTGDQMMPDNTFTNASRSYLLVQGFTGAVGDDLDTNDNGTLDATPWAFLADSVAVIDGSGPLIYADAVVGPDGTFLAAGGYRDPEVTGGWVMHDFFDFAAYTPTAGTRDSGIALNEISVSTTGTDVEFVEILSDPATDLSDLTLLSVRSGGEIDRAIAIEGQTGDNGYYLVGNGVTEATFGVTVNQSIADNTFTNASRSYLLVRDFSGAAGDDIDLDDNGVIDAAAWGEIVDSVAVIDDDGPILYSNAVVGPDGTFLAAGGYRLPERTGDWVMHDFFDFSVYTPTAGTGDTTGGGGGGGPVETVISAIQGTGDATPMDGMLVTIEAIVTGDFQTGDADALRDLDGFFVMEEASDRDGDATTSEGIYIYDPTILADVSLGDRVRITGTVSEFQGQTQISATEVTITQAVAVADVNSLAVAVSLDAIDAVVVDGAGKYAADLEAYEGMLVTFTDTLTVNEMFQMDRFNEIRLSVGGKPQQFTQLYDPDPVAYDAWERAIGSDQVIFDDGLNLQNAPILPEADLNGDGVYDTSDGFTMGDTITGLTGILNWGWAGNSASGNSWRVRSVDDGNVFADTGTRDATPPDLGGSLTVASFNVLNFFSTLDVPGNPGSGPASLAPRGADSVEEFDRQLDKLATTLLAMGADVFGLIEIENEFSFDQNGDGLVAIEMLVDEMNARIGSVSYAAVDIARGFVDVSDAISVAMIYDRSKVSLVEGSVRILDDSVLPSLDETYSGAVFDGSDTNRAPLAATFVDASTGEDFTVAVAHMKSKGGSGTGGDADQLDGAGAFNEMRTEGVRALKDWLDGFADEDLLVLGDFNAYAQEDPIDAMLAGGFTDLGSGGDTYVFDGKTGTLDYAFGSAGIMDNVTGAAAWNINAPEPDAEDYNLDFGRDPAIFDGSVPWRASDHDPVMVGLEFDTGPEYNVITGTSGFDVLVGTAADDWIVLGGGVGDIALGADGADVFDFAENAANGRYDVTRIYGWTAEDRLTGFEAADIHASTVVSTGFMLRFAYGADNDVAILHGALPAELSALFLDIA